MKKRAFFFICALLVFNTTWAQDFIVKGKIVDEQGLTLPGVNVFEKGTSNGTISDGNGIYAITLNSPDDMLVFSFIGRKMQELRVGTNREINVTLEADVIGLEEVVSIGYGTVKRKDVTGSVANVRLENTPIAAQSNINPLQALQGTTPGVNIGAVSSAGGSPSLLIRGQNSLTANNNPLIVLDGIVFHGSINEISTEDIASFDILKDASAASIYGSRSANGVILITTKRGKSAKPVFTYNVFAGFQDWTKRPDMRTGEDFIQWRKDNLSIRGQEDLSMEGILWPLELQAYNEGHTMDWTGDITQVAPLQNHQLSVSGSTGKTNYYVSGSLMNQQGIVANDTYDKVSFLTKLENKVTDWLTIGTNLYYNSRDYSGISPNLYYATYMTPYSYKYVEGYEDQLQRFPTSSTSLLNPYWGNPNVGSRGILDDDMDKRSSYRATGFIQIDIPQIEGLSYRLNVSANKSVNESAFFHHEYAEINTLIPEQIENPSAYLNKAFGWKNTSTASGWSADNLLTYERDFGNHSINLLLGYTREYATTASVRFQGSDFAGAGTTVLGWNGLALGNSEKRSGSTSFSEWSNVGYIGRATYSYNDRYYLTANFRRDGYSAFAPGHKFGNFPGVSAAWTISEEDFIKDNLGIVDFLKMRVSYGQNGNQGINPYSTYARIGTGTTIFGSTPFIYSYPSSLANKELSWETTTALNLGLNFALYAGRVTGSVDVYTGSTTNQLLTRNLPIMTGYNSILTNIAEIDNKGIELYLNTVNIQTTDGFKWETGVAFWLNRNELVSLYGEDADGDGLEDDDIGSRLFIGKSLGVIYDYTVDGIVQTEDTEYIEQFGFNPGDLMIRDISGPDGVPDGEITADDRSIIGYSKPNFSMNITNTVSYKNFELYFDINIIAGGGQDNYYLAGNSYALNPGRLMPDVANWLNNEYWMPDNQSTVNPRPNYGNPYGYGFYQDRTFARLQNLTLSYTFDKKVANKFGVNSLKVYASGKNLLTSTDWIGLDPENAGHIAGSNPVLRMFILGANISF